MTAEHPVDQEELMAYLDGELSAERSMDVHTHLSQCRSCKRFGDELRGISHDLALWELEAAPLSLSPPALPDTRSTGGSPLRWVVPAWGWQFASAATIAAVLLLVLTLSSPFRARQTAIGRAVAPPAGTRSAQELVRGEAANLPEAPPPRTARTGPMIARTALLRIVTDDFDGARAAVNRISTDVAGFIDHITASSARGDARSLTATVRVPAERLDSALTAFRRLGQVTSESQNSEDVAEQVVDLNARLSNARNTETRLTGVLKHRTGRIDDVLAVEREIGRVRGEIERMDAERKTLDRRVTYAFVTLEIGEERKAGLDLGPLPIRARIRNALIDGFRGAFESGLVAVLLVATVGPTLVLWTGLLAWPVWLMLRRKRG